MYVVDDPGIREALDSLIRSVGFRVETFASARDFLDRNPVNTPGCLVLDVRLPARSGLDLQAGTSPVRCPPSHHFHDRSRRYTHVGARHESWCG
ncbi:MAG: Nitrogen regulation protein [Bryobacterales bacterium]|nr:Nitrogen regulation protein [Bryobacterales bacterium]